MKIVDTHCHFDDDIFNDIRDEVVEKSLSTGIVAIVNPAVYFEKFEHIHNLSEKYHIVYPAFGIHPLAASNYNNIDEICKKIEIFSKYNKKTVAIGEIGLDFKLEQPDRKTQIKVFIAQLEVARSLNLPVLIHCRRSVFKVYQLLKKYYNNSNGGIMHAFSGSGEMAEKFIEMGFYISFAGSITYPNAKRPVENVRNISLNNTVVETDSPDITPYKFKGKVNKPYYIIEIIKKIAEIKEMSLDKVSAQLFKNSVRILKL